MPFLCTRIHGYQACFIKYVASAITGDQRPVEKGRSPRGCLIRVVLMKFVNTSCTPKITPAQGFVAAKSR